MLKVDISYKNISNEPFAVLNVLIKTLQMCYLSLFIDILICSISYFYTVMKQFLTIIAALLCGINADCQSLKKYAIGKSGCSAYIFCDPGSFKVEKSPDSSDVYTSECTSDSVSYGIICIKLREKMPDLKTAEEVMIAYLDYIKEQFGITKTTGYGKGHRLNKKEETRGVIDYWEDKDGLQYKVTGWTDGAYLAVMYVYANKELPYQKTSLFLEGLRLPGM